jgi:hypothetical protein
MRMLMSDGNSKKLPELVTDHNKWHKCIKCGMSVTQEPMWRISKEITRSGKGYEGVQLWKDKDIVACTVCAPDQGTAFKILGFSCVLYGGCVCGKCSDPSGCEME